MAERLMVDLCCGLKGASAPFEEHGWDVVGVDVRDDLQADVVADVRRLPLSRCEPTLLWASPPCTEFTRYRLPWWPDDDPDLSLVEACLDAVDDLGATWWVLENVQGLHDFIGEPSKKWGPWYLWGEFPPFDPGPVVYKNQNQLPKENRSEQAAKVPYELADALRRAIETFDS